MAKKTAKKVTSKVAGAVGKYQMVRATSDQHNVWVIETTTGAGFVVVMGPPLQYLPFNPPW